MSYISLPFRIDTAGTSGIGTNTSESQKYKQYASCILLTSLGERVMRPSYGSALVTNTFLPTGSPIPLENQIREALSLWLPEITVISVSVSINDDSGQVQALVSYRLPDQTTETITLIERNIGDVGDGNVSGITRFTIKTEEPYGGSFRTKVTMPTGQVIYE